jgi:hypothetical protein
MTHLFFSTSGTSVVVEVVVVVEGMVVICVVVVISVVVSGIVVLVLFPASCVVEVSFAEEFSFSGGLDAHPQSSSNMTTGSRYLSMINYLGKTV